MKNRNLKIFLIVLPFLLLISLIFNQDIFLSNLWLQIIESNKDNSELIKKFDIVKNILFVLTILSSVFWALTSIYFFAFIKDFRQYLTNWEEKISLIKSLFVVQWRIKILPFIVWFIILAWLFYFTTLIFYYLITKISIFFILLSIICYTFLLIITASFIIKRMHDINISWIFLIILPILSLYIFQYSLILLLPLFLIPGKKEENRFWK